MSEYETAPTRERRGREQSATSSNVQAKSNAPRPFMHKWRSAIFNDVNMHTTTKLALLALAEYADKVGKHCEPAASSIGRMCCMHERTVRRVLDEAHAARRFIARLERPGKRPLYRLVLPKGADTTTARAPKGIKATSGVAPGVNVESSLGTPGAVSGVQQSEGDNPWHKASQPRALPARTPGGAPDEQAFDLGLKQENNKRAQELPVGRGDESEELPDDHRVYDVAHARGVSRDLVKLALRVFLDEGREPCGVDWRDIFRREVGRNWANLWVNGNCSERATLTAVGIHKAHVYGMSHLIANEKRAR